MTDWTNDFDRRRLAYEAAVFSLTRRFTLLARAAFVLPLLGFVAGGGLAAAGYSSPAEALSLTLASMLVSAERDKVHRARMAEHARFLAYLQALKKALDIE